MSDPVSTGPAWQRIVGQRFTVFPFTLANTAALPGYVVPSYTKLPNGLVVLRGSGYCTDAVAVDAILGTLPVGYRPSATVIGPYDPTGAGRVDILANGGVQQKVAVGAGAYYVTFHHIFLAEN